jgi:hypothetical protein
MSSVSTVDDEPGVGVGLGPRLGADAGPRVVGEPASAAPAERHRPEAARR